MSVEYWYMFPVAIVIASIANGAGVGGATFFSPLFLLLLRLEPAVAIGTALVTEVFGFASGVIGHARARTIDWSVVRFLAAVTVPAAIVGSLLSGIAPATALKVILGVGLIGVAFVFIRHEEDGGEDIRIAEGIGVVDPSIFRRITAADGTVFEYRVCRRREGRVAAGLGGLFLGLISTGLGEANSLTLVERCRIPTRVAVASSVTVVAITALVASITHFVDFAGNPEAPFDQIASIIAFTIPGVLIGGQLGPKVVAAIPERRLIRALGWLFLAVAMVTLAEAALG